MARLVPARPAALPHDLRHVRKLADQALSRAAGAPLIGGNRVRILKDAAENYPAWTRAIIDARRSIHIEMYIIRRDPVGRRFIELLATKARAGVKVRVIYDWFGTGFAPLFGLFRPLVEAGGEVHAFNPPSLTPIIGWVRRDHRKLIAVDGRIAFVSGLCIAQEWEGRPERRQDPWRDTGVEITGPAVASVEAAFAESWRLVGGTMDPPDVPEPADTQEQGGVNLRVVATEPFVASVFQLDLLVASMARRTLWITDAYFLGTSPYLEALRRAAGDGVDVRLLLPQGSDVGWTVPVSRTLYRTLLEAGVRIFEWNGTMIHAKTAVADGRWARIGSTNLNITSWIGNWELDVAIEDPGVAGALATQFERDLAQSTEIVLRTWRRPVPPPAPPRVRARRSARRVMRTVTGVGRSLGAVVTGNRPLEDYEVPPLIGAGAILTGLAALAFWHPLVVAAPLAVIAGWTGLGFIVEAIALWSGRRRKPAP
ncbi:MAG: phospholipase D-like domain-containing protein [Vicinamibacterales bacterium]